MVWPTIDSINIFTWSCITIRTEQKNYNLRRRLNHRSDNVSNFIFSNLVITTHNLSLSRSFTALCFYRFIFCIILLFVSYLVQPNVQLNFHPEACFLNFHLVFLKIFFITHYALKVRNGQMLTFIFPPWSFPYSSIPTLYFAAIRIPMHFVRPLSLVWYFHSVIIMYFSFCL